MSNRDKQMLIEHMQSVNATIKAYVAQIESGNPAADEPTVDETPISEYPLEIVNERGREFAVVICTGGPHIEVAADGNDRARLEGYWWGDRHTLRGEHFDTFLDYLIERD